MCYSKWTWTKIEDLKGDFDTSLEAFANFLDTEDCPSVIKDMLMEAKETFDKKQDKDSNGQNKQTSIVDRSQSCSQDSYSSSQSSILGRFNFRESIFNDINVIEEFNDPNLEIPLNTGSIDFDWYQYGPKTFLWYGTSICKDKNTNFHYY